MCRGKALQGEGAALQGNAGHRHATAEQDSEQPSDGIAQRRCAQQRQSMAKQSEGIAKQSEGIATQCAATARHSITKLCEGKA